MFLDELRVRDYKSVTDSGLLRITEGVTCLVGKNESGKTAILEAIYRLNPIPTGHPDSFVPLRDFPRPRWARERDSVQDLTPVSATFRLEQSDLGKIEAEFGPDVLTGTEVTRSRDYSGDFSTNVNIDQRSAIAHLAAKAGLDPTLAEGCATVAQLRTKLSAIDDPPAAVAELLATITDLDLPAKVRAGVRQLYPKFLYFDEYSSMPGRLSIPRLQSQPADLTAGERTGLSLLRLAGVETADFTESEYEARKASLEAASNELTSELFRYWSQNKDLFVELDLDFRTPAGPSGEPPFLDIRIRNLRHGVTLNFGERSAGFVWFFSFLAAFSEYRDSAERIVLLLDEPGMGLHASAQSDLLRYIDERLAPAHQVIYTTHSPFMVDPTRLDRVRTVEDVDKEGTRVSEDVLAASRDTRFPLQAALGYELAQSLFIAPNTLIVEGPSDYIYLSVLSAHLRSMDRTSLSPLWVITPVGGLDKIPTFVALLGAQLNVAVVMDSAVGGSQKINDLIQKGILDGERVIGLGEITETTEADIEDLFSASFYLDLVRRSGAATPPVGDLPQHPRIVRRIEQAIGAPLDHYAPARHLLEHQIDLLPALEKQDLERFEKLFSRLNALLA